MSTAELVAKRTIYFPPAGVEFGLELYTDGGFGLLCNDEAHILLSRTDLVELIDWLHEAELAMGAAADSVVDESEESTG